MTREQALENALRLALRRKSRLTGEELEQCAAALALPPDGVNAEMLAALRLAANDLERAGYIMVQSSMPEHGIRLHAQAEDLRAFAARASHIPMPSKTFNPPAQA